MTFFQGCCGEKKEKEKKLNDAEVEGTGTK